MADVVREELHSLKVMPWTLIHVDSISQYQYLHQSCAISNNVLSVLGHRLYPLDICGASTLILAVLLTLLIILSNPRQYVSVQGLFICLSFFLLKNNVC